MNREVDLVLEIGTEEIPASCIPQALASLKQLFEEKMQRARLAHGPVLTVGTPRRLALLAEGVAQKQEDAYQDILGPPKKLAFDSQGNPTTAALRFAEAQGLRVEDLNVIGTAKGEYLCARRKEAGQATADVLPQLLPDLIASIPFPKTMRWNQSNFRFVRPIRWILAVASGEVIPFELAGVKSGNNSYGHRFMSPQTFSVTDPDNIGTSYMEGCRKNFVLVDPEERKEVIRKGLRDLALKLNGQVIEDPELLETVAFLVEYPVVFSGRFDPEFLKLPREALISVMRDAQFYFSFEAQDKSLADAKGGLLSNFALAINSQVKDPAKVVANNERVLKAKLTDAKFFFEEDSKVPLEKRVENLKGLVFQAKLGSAYDKTMRLITLSDYLAQKLAPDLREVVKRAAFLAKADLTTQMVIEFPKLQGVMGREYARLSGEKPEVAQAIHEHYLPLSYGREIPQSLAGAIVSIADKFDTIVGCFAVGLVPSGTADPYGLRRAALGIIQIILEKKLSLSLQELFDEAAKPFGLSGTLTLYIQMLTHVRGRLFTLFAQDYPYELVDAVLNNEYDPFNDIYLCSLKIKALDDARRQEKLLPLAIAFKRINDIINAWVSKAEKQVARTIKRTKDPETRKRLEADRLFPIISGPASIDEEPQERLLSDPYECRLYQEHMAAKEKIRECLEKREFAIALDILSGLKSPIDDFFDHVLVITGEEELRLNRLRLLNSIRHTFHKIADFSRIPV